MILTEELIRDGATTGRKRNGDTYHAWTRKQLELIAWDCDTSTGWLDRTIGQYVHENLYQEFIKLNPKCPAHKKMKRRAKVRYRNSKRRKINRDKSTDAD